MGLNNGGTDKNLDYDQFMDAAPGGGAPPQGGNNYNQAGPGGQGGGYNSNQGSYNQGQGVSLVVYSSLRLIF